MKKREKYVAPLCSQSSMHELIGGVRPLAWTQMTFRALALLGIVYQKNCKKLFFCEATYATKVYRFLQHHRKRNEPYSIFHQIGTSKKLWVGTYLVLIWISCIYEWRQGFLIILFLIFVLFCPWSGSNKIQGLELVVLSASIMLLLSLIIHWRVSKVGIYAISHASYKSRGGKLVSLESPENILKTSSSRASSPAAQKFNTFVDNTNVYLTRRKTVKVTLAI